MAYHDRLGLVLMYGDGDDQLWGWDGTRWHVFDGPGAAGRKHLRMVYDVGRDRIVLFGGASRTAVFGDTWEWDGQRWALVSDEGPGARMGHGLAYDQTARHIVLYGGADASGAFHSDTWSWDGARWTRVDADGARARIEHGMTYDVARRRVVIAGGMAPGGQPLRDDAWTWDGRRWTTLAAGAARWAPLVADPLTSDLLLIGGQSDEAVHGDILRLTGSSWRRLEAAPALPARQSHAAALDPRRRRVIVFGGTLNGRDFADDLWEFDGRRWEQRTR